MTLHHNLGDDTKVESITTQRPEQLGIGLGIDADHLTGRLDELELDKVVDGGAEPATGVRHAAAESKSAIAGVGDSSRWRDEIVERRLVIDVSTEGAGGNVGQLLLGVNTDVVHRRKVDAEGILRHSPRTVGTLAAHRHGNVMRGTELDRSHHVLDARDHRKGNGFGPDGQILVPRSGALGVELFLGGIVAADQKIAAKLGGEGLDEGRGVFDGRGSHFGGGRDLSR
mmetsp:Transcript_2056/g.3463  ORF Transcript_2056/g.3463 Transcript_2056/m.3463 type:complete len:227 (-) Transcript_2056:23-703(-)